jgi:hypothetical protein
MNLQLLSGTIFRDKTRLRYTKDGRLLIKTEVVKELNLGATRHMSYMVHSIDQPSGTLVVVFTKSSPDNRKQVLLNDISGTKILALKRVLLKYPSPSAQYVNFKVKGQEELWVTFKISGE